MSNLQKNERSKVIVPYVGIEPIMELAKFMYKNSFREKEMSELEAIWGGGKSNLKNITPTFSILDLGKVSNGVFTLTPDGLVFADGCNSLDLEKSKKVIQKKIVNSESLQFVKSLLETKLSISVDEIGTSLSERFNKNWKNIKTTKHAGNACASILSFARIGYFYNGMLTINPPTISYSSTVPAPEATFNEILDVLNALHGFERAKLSDISIKMKQKESYAYQKLNICTILKLVDRYSSNIYRVTEKGEKLIDPIIDKVVKQEQFYHCLIQSPYKELIFKILQIKHELTNENIGDVLEFYLKRSWSEETKKLYAKKFTSLLINANILNKIKPATYEIIVKEIPKNIEDTENNKIEENKNSNFIYELGKGIGNLEALSKSDQNTIFKDNIVLLKSMLNEHEDLKLAFDMLTKNFEIAQKTKNEEIYKASLDFIRNKIKEKFNLLEEII